ncbi:energy transducer TonB [Flavobacterium sp. ZT3R25]|uniref:energy transducer TonB n=1 Tax=Flavobacterium galactosi TaxID=3398735 RepID=UPI003A8409A9
MKSNLLILLLILTPTIFFSQNSNDKTIYLDSIWKETVEGNHKYYRIIKDYYSEKDNYKIYDYHKNGLLQMEGSSKTKNDLTREGEFIYYYENGNKKQISNYKKSRLNGKQLEWYENGDKRLEGEYIADDKTYSTELKINQFWDTKNIQKVIDGSGYYEEIFKYFYAKGNIKNGLKDGTWEGYDKKMNYTFTETYNNSKLISGVSIDSNKVVHNYTIAELKPIPKKGYNDFYKHVGQKFNTNKLPRGTGGKIFISFIVDKEGKITEPKIIKSVSSDADVEALRILESYGNWNPGEIRGIKVKSKYTLPITIQTAR